MDKNAILAIALSLLVLIGWTTFFGPSSDQPAEKPKDLQEEVKTSGQEGSAPPSTAPQPRGKEVSESRAGTATPVADRELVVETPLYRMHLSVVGPTIRSLTLKAYRETPDPQSPPLEMITLNKTQEDFLRMEFVPKAAEVGKGLAYETAEQGPIVLASGAQPRDIVFHLRTPQGLLVTKTFRISADAYTIGLKMEVENGTEQAVEGHFESRLAAIPPPSSSSSYAFLGLALLMDNTLQELDLDEPKEERLQGAVDWIAYEDTYFISALLTDPAVKSSIRATRTQTGLLQIAHVPPSQSLAPGQKASTEVGLYVGPRDIAILKEVGRHLDLAVNFGWTDIIAKPLLYVLNFFDGFFHNYGFAIILVTILVKILFWPLTHKSYQSMKEMQKLQPIMAKIREKYKNDKQKMNQEMMALYKTYKVNPMGGCLPMIIQIPVFFALFRVLGSSIELRHAPFMLWINDLSAPDRLLNFPFSIPFMTPPFGIPVLTLLMGASMFIQQKMTPTPGDPSQAKIMMLMPVIFTFMFINFPSGLVLYWLVNNILSIGQQYRIQKIQKK